MSVSKIVITGGPCAGKTTAMSRVSKAFTKMGYTVLIVAETATELKSGGISEKSCGSNAIYQKYQLMLQLEKERIFELAAKMMNKDKVLIICDRGALDNKAYMSEADFYSTLKEIGAREVELRDNYDAVFHLVTAAKGAEEFYTLANNNIRSESSEEAALVDDKLISAWTGHPHFRLIDNSGGIDDKITRLIAEISAFLGEPEPYEIERKFLIEYPDIAWLESIPNCQRVEIIQTYLNSNSGEEVRIRQRGIDGEYIYFKTVKRKVSDVKRIELEERLSKDEYLKLLMDFDSQRRPIRKTRYCLTFENQYFEIDVYPFWKDKAIVEIELSDEAAEIKFPKELKVIKEVTDDENYKNSNLAKVF